MKLLQVWLRLGFVGSLLLASCGGRTPLADVEGTGDGDGLGDGDGSGDGDEPGPAECRDARQCTPDERCENGFCVSNCAPYAERCGAGGPEYCDPEAGWTQAERCLPGQTCVEDFTVAYCREPEPMQCPPGETWCSADNAALFCTPEGRIVELFSCEAQDAVCSGGICFPRVCEPGVVYCRDGTIFSCASDGTSAVALETCPAGTVCAPAGQPACEVQVCTPSSSFCQGNVLSFCNEWGTDYAALTDCGVDRCVDGTCREVICEPGSLDCVPEGVVRCSETGTEWQLVDACTDEEYCLVGISTCQTRVCVPNQPVCLDNTTAQCNSAGSGYLTGMDCGSQTCVGGTCRDTVPFFVEDFEDGDLAGWMSAGLGYMYSVVTSTAGEGIRSVTLSGGANGHYDGIFQVFDSVTPERVTYRARHDGGGSGTYFTLHDAVTDPGTDNEVVFVYFRSDGYIAVGSPGGSEEVRLWQPQTWYEMTLDIDWQNRTFDISVDGVLHLSENPFRGGTAVSGVRMVSLYHYDNSVGYWDDIRFE